MNIASFGGLRIFVNPLCTERKITRVPGGYHNHWLIRAEVTVPAMFLAEAQGAIYCHPDLYEKLKRSVKP